MVGAWALTTHRLSNAQRPNANLLGAASKARTRTHALPTTHHSPQTHPLTSIPDITTKPELLWFLDSPLSTLVICHSDSVGRWRFSHLPFEKKQGDPIQRTRHVRPRAFHAVRKPSPFYAPPKPALSPLKQPEKREKALYHRNTHRSPQDKKVTLSVSPKKKASRKKQPRNRFPPSSAHLRRHLEIGEKEKDTPNPSPIARASE